MAAEEYDRLRIEVAINYVVAIDDVSDARRSSWRSAIGEPVETPETHPGGVVTSRPRSFNPNASATDVAGRIDGGLDPSRSYSGRPPIGPDLFRPTDSATLKCGHTFDTAGS